MIIKYIKGMISRTYPAKKVLNLITRFCASSVENSDAPKGKSYRMPEMKKETSSETQTGNEDKSYRMPTEEVLLPFRTSLPVRMHSHRVLLYLNKQRLTTPQLLQLPYAAAFMSMIYMIRYNPWYMTFPASLPIMIAAEIFVFFAWIYNKKHNKYIIERVYLYNSNKIEFSFSNKIRRKLKDTEDFHMFLCPEDLKTPPHNEDGSLAWGQKGAKFPQSLEYKKNPQTNEIEYVKPTPPAFYGWTKYTNSYTPYIFPKSYEYANWEILVPLMSGRFIDVEYGTNEILEGLDIEKDYASPEQELQWIAEDQKKNQEYRKAMLEGKEVSLN